MASALRDVVCSRLQDTRFRTTAAAVVGGIAVAPLAVWATMTVAHVGARHTAAGAALAGPASPSSVATRPVSVPHSAYHPHAPAHPRHARHGRVSEAAPPPPASASSEEPASTSGSSTSASGAGTSSWQGTAASYGVPGWALNMASSMSHR